MSDRLANLGDYVQNAMASWKIPGVALAVIRGDEVLHMAGYGVRNLETQTPVTPETRFAIASCTKAFTAMGVALLVDQGAVEWDKPVRDYLPTFKLQDAYVAEKITLRDMLSHRSGLPRHDLSWYNAPFTREQLIENMAHHEFSRGFREAWQYQNLMYVTAGYVTGVVANISWEEFIQTRIFDRLGMAASTFSAAEMRKSDNYAMAYRVKRGETDTVELMDFYDNQVMGPAGSIHASAADLVKWLKVHLNDGRSGDVQLVSAANLIQMHQPQMIMPPDAITAKMLNTTLMAYGMGWFIKPYRGYTLIHHGGNIDGFSLMTAFVPQEKLGIVALTNIEARPLRDVLMYEVVDRALDLPDNDWNGKYHSIYGEMFKGMDQDKDTTDTERVPDTTPTHALADYVGDFEAEGYIDFRVKLEGGKLFGHLAGEWFPLEHYHYDIFILNLERFEERLKVSFGIDARGKVATLGASIEPAVKEILFKRKPISVNAALLNALVGRFDMPFDGLMLDVAVKVEQKLFAALTGQTEIELIPYQVVNSDVEFNLKDVPGASIQFMKSDSGAYDLAIFKQMGVVYKAPRLKL